MRREPGRRSGSWHHRPPRRPPRPPRRGHPGRSRRGRSRARARRGGRAWPPRSRPRSPVPTAVASRPTRSTVCRRREIPRGGATSSTVAPTIRSAPDDRRRTARSPGATAIGPARRRVAQRDPVGQVERVPAAPADARLDRRRPGMEAHPRPIGQGAAQGDEDPVAGRRPMDRPSGPSRDAGRPRRRRPG